MTKTATYGLWAGAAVLLFIVGSKLVSSSAPAATRQSSASGLSGGTIRDIASGITSGLGRIFGSGSAGTPDPVDSDSTKTNWGALSFLTDSQKLDLGLQIPTDRDSGSFFGPDVDPDTGAYTG